MHKYSPVSYAIRILLSYSYISMPSAFQSQLPFSAKTIRQYQPSAGFFLAHTSNYIKPSHKHFTRFRQTSTQPNLQNIKSLHSLIL